MGPLQGHRIGIHRLDKRGSNCRPATDAHAGRRLRIPRESRVTDMLNQVDPKTGTWNSRPASPTPPHSAARPVGRIRVQVDERKGAIEFRRRRSSRSRVCSRVHRGRRQQAQMRAIVTGNRTGELWIVEQGSSRRTHHRGRAVEGAARRHVEPQPYREPKPGTDIWRNSSSITPSLRCDCHHDGDPRGGGHPRPSRGCVSGSGAAGGADHHQLFGGNAQDLEKTVAQPIEERFRLDGILYYLRAAPTTAR